MFDAAGTRRRVAVSAPHADIQWLAEAGHFLLGHGVGIDAFLAKALLP